MSNANDVAQKESQILHDLQNGKITAAQATALLEEVRQKPLTTKVSAKGGVSVYGLQRFPVTLYTAQWRRVLGFAEAILAACEEADKLNAAEAAAEKAA